MYCTKCGAITTNKLATKCPRPGCKGEMKPNTGGFSILRYKPRPKAL